MSILRFVVIILLLASCSKATIDTDIPVCIQDILDDSELSSDVKTIRVQENSTELEYWINTDFTFFDGVEYIVSAQCDTLCAFCGECFPGACTNDYDDTWVVIWEK